MKEKGDDIENNSMRALFYSLDGLFVLIKTAIWGIILAISCYVAKFLYIRLMRPEHIYLIVFGTIFLTIIVTSHIVFYKYWKGIVLESIKRILHRLDIAMVFLFVFPAGIFLLKDIHLYKIQYLKFLSDLDETYWALIVLIFLFMYFVFCIRRVVIFCKSDNRNKNPPIFLSDREEKFMKDDLLDFAPIAKKFAEKILNGGSPESMVFGVDAPWGSGKSTFINFCKEHWKGERRGEVITFSFSALSYENPDDLAKKFIDGLIIEIKKNVFAPEIGSMMSRYYNLIKGISFKGFNLDLSQTNNIDDAFDNLDNYLSSFNRKVIIIMDDLDRLSFSTVKSIISVLKKSFSLRNVSYVLCYDTENLGALEREDLDTEKVTEFLEKFVNVKFSLFVGSGQLKKVIKETFMDRKSRQYLKQESRQALHGLLDILDSPDYYLYAPFIGDLRKIKRYINILRLFEIDKDDYTDTDFNMFDMTNLILIYINYPSIFRKIYLAETGNEKRRGFFSALMPFDPNYPKEPKNSSIPSQSDDSKFKNSPLLYDYIAKYKEEESLTENQIFLLKKIFLLSDRLAGSGTGIRDISSDAKSSYACFNGGWSVGRNLEQYLYRIVESRRPPKNTQENFYSNRIKEIKQDSVSVSDVFLREEFLFEKGEKNRHLFFEGAKRELMKTDDKLSEFGSKLIGYILNNISDYSLIKYQKEGWEIAMSLRHSLHYLLVRLLNSAGWSDKQRKGFGNDKDNIAEIAEWIFGEGKHEREGVIESLSKEKRGILGFYDLMTFRLLCSADRGGDVFNLQRALSYHGSKDGKIIESGAVRDIAVEEMREISQKIYKIFEEQYIKKNKNIFKEVDDLTEGDFGGKYLEFFKNNIEKDVIDSLVEESKSRIKSFIVYQLGNSIINYGVGCGYYDEVGDKNSSGISKKINDYLFKQCFNGEKNYEYFIDYLFLNYRREDEFSKDSNYIPDINEFTKVLDRDRLIDYWKANEEKIRGMEMETKTKTIVMIGYEKSYEKDLLKLYEYLDELIGKGKSS